LLDILALIGVLVVSFFLNDSPDANPVIVGFLQLVLWLFPVTAALGAISDTWRFGQRSPKAVDRIVPGGPLRVGGGDLTVFRPVLSFPKQWAKGVRLNVLQFRRDGSCDARLKIDARRLRE
jgi:hypothetical protein